MQPESKTRMSGIVLHPTSLPGRFGIGDLGSEARQFVDFLASSRQRLWQILPLGPTHEDWYSPYSSFSAFAGNPLLVSPEVLLEQGLLSAGDLDDMPALPSDHVAWRSVAKAKRALLTRAHERFQGLADRGRAESFERFCQESSSWLEDYALFMAIREAHGGLPWSKWDRGLCLRDVGALASARSGLSASIALHKYMQFEVARQWAALKRYANERGVSILGDIPIYVAYDSADVWARPDYFQLEPGPLTPVYEAGVPPDGFFSDTGQLWGNPVYDWERLRRDGYAFWVDRLRQCFAQFDYIRIDHFRGFEAFWVIPPGQDPRTGHWVQGPGAELFTSLRRELHRLPIVVEDLGLITPAVHALRKELDFPGMFVLQFAFDNPDSPYLPYKCSPDFVMYTGTHDTETSIGWYHALPEHRRRGVDEYLGAYGPDGVHWDLIRQVWSSTALWALAPLQDVLGLGTEARMNVPGVHVLSNWSWRFPPEALGEAHCERLATLTRTYGRA